MDVYFFFSQSSDFFLFVSQQLLKLLPLILHIFVSVLQKLVFILKLESHLCFCFKFFLPLFDFFQNLLVSWSFSLWFFFAFGVGDLLKNLLIILIHGEQFLCEGLVKLQKLGFSCDPIFFSFDCFQLSQTFFKGCFTLFERSALIDLLSIVPSTGLSVFELDQIEKSDTFSNFEFFLLVRLKKLSIEFLQLYKLPVLVLEAFFQRHQLLNVDLFSLPKLLICVSQTLQLSISGLSIDSDGRGSAIRVRIFYFSLLDGIVGIIFGSGRKIQFRDIGLTIHLFVIINYSSFIIVSFSMKRGKKIDQEIDSDSSSNSSQQNLDDIMQSTLKRRVIKVKEHPFTIKWKVCIASSFILLMILILLKFRSLSHPLDNYSQSSQQDSNNKKFKDSFTSTETNFKHEVTEYKNIPFMISLSPTIELQNAEFLKNDLKSGTNQWFLKQLAICIPNHIVNSATKIEKDLFAQATAYENVNILTRKIYIPAEQLYRFEAPRQFLHNVSLIFKEKRIVYDHYSPLLLVLIIRFFEKGIFVTTRNEWPLLQQNLIFNDVLPLANPYPLKTLINSHQYQVLVTYDLQLAIELLVSNKRQIIVVIEFLKPTKVQTSFLLSMKLFKLDGGIECHEREITLFQEGNWRIDQQVFILPGWYVMTDINNDLSFGYQLLNYQALLIKEEDRQCKPTILYDSQQIFFSASKKHVRKLPFLSLNFFSQDALTFSTHFKSVYAYLNQKTPKGSVFLDSGSMYLLLVVIWTLPSSVEIYIKQEYPLMKELIKHLVLNSLEKVKVINETSAENKQYQMIITDDIKKAKSYKTSKWIFEAPLDTNALPYLQYNQLVEDECLFPSLKQIKSEIIPQGIYLVSSTK